jgi:hypothetical protein
VSKVLKVDDELQELIPPLTAEEYRQLEENIVAEGCRDALVVWGNTIIDGHNRYKICTQHNIEFNTVEKEFTDKEQAKDWIDMNQLGRRNLTPDQMRLLRGRRYNRLKNPQGGDHRSKGQNVPLINTAETLAGQHGVTEKTIKRDGKFYEEVERLKEQYPEEIGKIYKGEKRAAQVLKTLKRAEKIDVYKDIAEALPAIGDRYKLICADINSVEIDPESIDVIITDPPYPKEYLPLYEGLAVLANKALKPGGSLIVMVGQSYLPEILGLMMPHIKYHWMASYLTPGGQSVQLWQKKVNTFWKPLLWFVKGE